MKTRIYTVTNQETGKVRMVRASSASAAISHVVRGLLTCIVTDTESGIVNRGLGIEVEVAGEAQEATA
jgi:hypothetical protein